MRRDGRRWFKRAQVAFGAAVLGLVSLAATCAPPAPPSLEAAVLPGCTGGTLIVPPDVTVMTFEAYGAAGGYGAGGNALPGGGGYALAAFAVTPGEEILAVSGCVGQDGAAGGIGGPGIGDGGTGGLVPPNGGGGGGGGSAVVSASPSGNVALVAGGGGGSGAAGTPGLGDGGGGGGVDGQSGTSGAGAGGGGAGQFGPGIGGGDGAPGFDFDGGDGGVGGANGGGGGGGGWWGGGGGSSSIGAAGGGGGGSGVGPPGTAFLSDVTVGHGLVIAYFYTSFTSAQSDEAWDTSEPVEARERLRG